MVSSQVTGLQCRVWRVDDMFYAYKLGLYFGELN